MKYTNSENKIQKENPFDLLDEIPLVALNGKITDFYKIKPRSKALQKLSLKDFVDDGIEYIKKETKDKNEEGYSAQIGSSGDYAKIGSSGDYAKIGSSGDYAKIGSSGDYAKIGSSGDSAQIGSSGDYAKIGSSGYSAQIGSSGYYAKIGSSGDYAKIGSSGYSAQIGSSGDSAQIGSSGDYAKIGSSGYSAQIGSSGYSAQIEITGDNSIGFACGFKSRIKAKKGTWISLAEYEENKKTGRFIPCFAKSAQIGNKDYVDAFGKVLTEDNSYMLIHKEFVPVLTIDGSLMIVLNKKKLGDYDILRTQYYNHYVENNKSEKQYVAKKGDFTAHGKSVKEAISDVEFKYLQSQDVQEHIKRVKEQGYITPNDYRLLTGACRYGTNKWLEENGFTWEDKKSIEEVLELTKGQYGHERLVDALKK